MGFVVKRDFGKLENWLMLLIKLAELLLLAKCWMANEIWSASNDAGVLSLSLERVWSEPGLVGPEEANTVMISYSYERAPKMRPFFKLKSLDSFSVNPSSISSDTWVINSPWNPGETVIRAWFFLGWSSWLSLLIAANFLFFLRLAIFEVEKNN